MFGLITSSLGKTFPCPQPRQLCESPGELSLDSLLSSGYQHVSITGFFPLPCSSSRILAFARCPRHYCLLFSIGYGLGGMGWSEGGGGVEKWRLNQIYTTVGVLWLLNTMCKLFKKISFPAEGLCVVLEWSLSQGRCSILARFWVIELLLVRHLSNAFKKVK